MMRQFTLNLVVLWGFWNNWNWTHSSLILNVFKNPQNQWLLKIKYLCPTLVLNIVQVPKKLQKTRFWKKKSVEGLGPTAQTTLAIIKSQVFDVPQANHSFLRDYKPKNLGDQACTHKLRMWLPYMFDAPHLHVCRMFMCMYKTFVAPVFLMQTYLHRTW